MHGFFVQGSGLDRTSTFATAIITPLKSGRQKGKAFFTSIYWLTRIDKPAKLLWFSPQLISSRVPKYIIKYLWPVPAPLGKCYQPEELGSIVSNTNTVLAPLTVEIATIWHVITHTCRCDRDLSCDKASL